MSSFSRRCARLRKKIILKCRRCLRKLHCGSFHIALLTIAAFAWMTIFLVLLETSTRNPIGEVNFTQIPVNSISSHYQSEESVSENIIPGEMGRPFVLPVNLTEEQRQLVTEGWERNNFNQYVSDLISVRRSIPDKRNEWCKSRNTSKILPVSELPVTSIIIVFHNEAWSTLVRSVHSILDRTRTELVGEILLVDDSSNMAHLKAPLESYMKPFTKVKIIRIPKRTGLIRARLVGANLAKGPVLTFLDSHIEATIGWLEPLLDRIARNRTTVVCPVIAVIDDKTLEFHWLNTTEIYIGGFDWSLEFRWHVYPQKGEKDQRQHTAEPVHSPTMAGGLFSIDKSYFEELGGYDPGFEIWGGENLELSFKIWMCGGILEVVPCSTVGHIFRQSSPYTCLDGVDTLKRNGVRLAKVWMDEYANIFYRRIRFKLGEYGDISSRLKLRDSLKCKGFDWYLKNVYTQQYIPEKVLVAEGDIQSLALAEDVSVCFDAKDEAEAPVELKPCTGNGNSQYWIYTKSGEIRRDELCVDYAEGDKEDGKVMMYNCHGQLGNQLWLYDDNIGLLMHYISKKCLTLESPENLTITMQNCDPWKTTQHWRFEEFNSTINTQKLYEELRSLT